MLLYVGLIAIANLALGYLAGFTVARRNARATVAEPMHIPTPVPSTFAPQPQLTDGESQSIVTEPAMTAQDYSSAGPQPETIETAIENFWLADPHRQRDLALAMIDVDRCAQLNAEYGPAAVDEVLERIAGLLVDPTSNRSLTVWHGGQRFVILLGDWVAADASDVLERIRHTIEETEFEHFGQTLKVTVSCAVATSLTEDTASGLLGRLNTTLKAAKLQGRNKTFLHAGLQPMPVDSTFKSSVASGAALAAH